MKHSNKEKDSDFFEAFEDWHQNKYNDKYRFSNKTPFFIKNPNLLRLGVIHLLLPALTLLVCIFLDLGVYIYVFLFLLCLLGIYNIIKYFIQSRK